uniref:MORN repeat-containing protein 5 n=1 Tax=Compsopogon caeruleus TaxID=31354 RepID=A0A7S1T7K0_9RHOD|mmetsp:Transcript_11922/g.24279  ORF Transcript_11922/g.24279 Transcript_11922/m.24279 type:complete len:241 (+) Transcript_11922:210-932(+)
MGVRGLCLWAHARITSGNPLARKANDEEAGEYPTKETDDKLFDGPCCRAILADGSKFDGNMIRGSIEGVGRMRHPDGQVYEGHFHRGQKHGLGVTRMVDGTKHVGLYQDNVAHGLGSMFDRNGVRVYVGDFRNGQPVDRVRIRQTGFTYRSSSSSVADQFSHSCKIQARLRFGDVISEVSKNSADPDRFTEASFSDSCSDITEEGSSCVEPLTSSSSQSSARRRLPHRCSNSSLLSIRII